MNYDGNVDLVQGYGDGITAVSLGNGNGTFVAVKTFSLLASSGLKLGDFNGDGNLDAVGHSTGLGNPFSISFGNGNGTFTAATTVLTTSGGYDPEGSAVGDFNNDGKLDLILGKSTFAVGDILYLAGNGDGTFKAAQTISAASTPYPTSFVIADFNLDGKNDFVVGHVNSDQLALYLGNGDGTFNRYATFATGSQPNLTGADLNGDGLTDILSAERASNQISIFIADGAGGFTKTTVASGASGPLGAYVGDINSDGAVDFITSDRTSNKYSKYIANTTRLSTSEYFHLETIESARVSLSRVDLTINRVQNELGKVGASQSRLQSALNTASIARENYAAAYSKISDVDVAEETAHLIRTSVKQDAASAILAQANLTPKIALKLLGIEVA